MADPHTQREFRNREFRTFLAARAGRPRPPVRALPPPPLNRFGTLYLPPLPQPLEQPPQQTHMGLQAHTATQLPLVSMGFTPSAPRPITVQVSDDSTARKRALEEEERQIELRALQKRPRTAAPAHTFETSPTNVATLVSRATATGLIPPVFPSTASSPRPPPASRADTSAHSTASRFECPMCGASAIPDPHRELHQRHERHTQWTCPQCGYFSQQPPNIEDQVSTDTLRPFRCTVCSMSFGRKGVWKKHVQMVHEHQRKFECDRCTLSFGLKSDLKRHTQSVHLKERPFACPVCSASFGRRSDLKRHSQSLHPDTTAHPSGKPDAPPPHL